MHRDTELQHLSERMGLEVGRLQENVKVAQLQLQKHEQEHQQHLESLQLRQREEQLIQIESSSQIGILQSQIQNMQNAASSAALEYHATSEQLRTCRLALEDQRKELEMLQQDRNRVEAVHQKKLMEKEQVIGSSESSGMFLFANLWHQLILLVQLILHLESQIQQLQVFSSRHFVSYFDLIDLTFRQVSNKNIQNN
jgi:hypothetical protein